MNIESNIPITKPLYHLRGTSPTAKFSIADQLQVGDSFLISKPTRSSLNVAYKSSKRFSPKKFTSRMLKEGVRVWRVE
jgi:hypothetical protein